MKISQTTNLAAGFSRVKVFACILAALILGDLLFRGSKGMKSIAQVKTKFETEQKNHPDSPVPPYYGSHTQGLVSAESAAPTNDVAKTNVPQPVVKKPVLRLGQGGQAGKLLRATADQKGVQPVNWPSDPRPRMTNPPPAAAHVPLPIAIPN